MNEQSGRVLKGVCVFGLVIVIVLAGLWLFLSRYGGIPLFAGFSGTPFDKALADYDREISADPGMGAGKRNGLLDALEKKALDTENFLSVLKRRRALARGTGDDVYTAAYSAAAGRAAKLYPYSGQIAAVMAESLSLRPLNEETREQLLELASLMSEGALEQLALAFSVYSGAMADPATARQLPRELFPLLCSAFEYEERERYLIDYMIRVLLEDSGEASAMIDALFDENPVLPEIWTFGAEFFYDHGNFLRSAELFSHFTDDEGLARQAGALWLAGFSGTAGTLWRAVATAGAAGDTRARSLYNMTAVVFSPEEEAAWLERLFAANPDYKPGKVFGLLRYSRLAVTDRALAILERAGKDEVLFELELLRRHGEIWAVDKTVAETWMLLNQHSGDMRLAEWAAWYFDFQRRHTETTLLTGNLERNGARFPWMDFHKAVAMIRAGNFSEAETLFRAVGGGVRRYGAYWQAAANTGLLLDLNRNPRGALDMYEIAAALQANEVLRLRTARAEQREPVTPPELKEAARMQLRIARTLRTLDREAESRRVLDYALDLDPGNLDAVLEKRRLSGGGIL